MPISSVINNGENKNVIDKLDVRGFNKIVITACESAYNAGVTQSMSLSVLQVSISRVELASEFRYKDPVIDGKTLVILISQSGETADTMLRCAKQKERCNYALNC